MADVGVKLTGDNSEFRNMLAESQAHAGAFAEKLGNKVADKVVGMRDIGTAVATALGISIEKIAEGVARMVIGFSKEQEESLKRTMEITAQIADQNIANMRVMNTEEQNHRKDLERAAWLNRDIAAAKAEQVKIAAELANADVVAVNLGKIALRTAEAKERIDTSSLELSKLSNALLEYEKKLRDQKQKDIEEIQKKEIEASSKAFEAQIASLETSKKIIAIKAEIARLEGEQADDTKTQAQQETLVAETTKRQNELIKEQGNLRKEITDIIQKNAEAERESASKKEDERRKDLSFAEQITIKQKEIRNWEAAIAFQKGEQLDATDSIKRKDEAIVQLKALQGKELERQIELAKLLLKPTSELTDQDKVRLQLLQNVTKQKEIDKETSELTGKLISGTITPAEKERLSVLIKETAEIKAQNANLLAQEGILYRISIGRVGSNYSDQSDASLAGVRARLESQIASEKGRSFGAIAGVGGSTISPELMIFQNELTNLMKEINSRSEVQTYAGRFGESAARGQFGDSAVDKALRDMQDSSTKTAIAVSKMQQQFQDFFKLKPI